MGGFSMYVYDKANELARALTESEEYKSYKAAKDKVDKSNSSKDMLKDFKKKQFELQAMQLSGQKPDEEKLSQIQSLYQVIILNPDIAEYLNAELKFSQMFSDIYNIIGKAVELDMDFLKSDSN
jgi:cell fate (sporulation/competence/biofilm development) regulator YlbF (YheA/YmcA/DUF963 family)